MKRPEATRQPHGRTAHIQPDTVLVPRGLRFKAKWVIILRLLIPKIPFYLEMQIPTLEAFIRFSFDVVFSRLRLKLKASLQMLA